MASAPQPPRHINAARGAESRPAPPPQVATRASAHLRPPASVQVAIQYLETSPIAVRGTATGRTYKFSAVQPVQLVESRDASALLSSRFFKRA